MFVDVNADGPHICPAVVVASPAGSPQNICLVTPPVLVYAGKEVLLKSLVLTNTSSGTTPNWWGTAWLAVPFPVNWTI